MSLGAGFSAAGFSPGGLGDVDLAPVPTANLLIDADNGRQQNARKINPYTKQYVTDATGALQGMSGISQMVLLRLLTVRNSSALANFGRASSPKVVSANTLRQIQSDVNQALADLVLARLVVVNSVSTINPSPTQVDCFVLWTDLTTGIEQSTAF